MGTVLKNELLGNEYIQDLCSVKFLTADSVVGQFFFFFNVPESDSLTKGDDSAVRQS